MHRLALTLALLLGLIPKLEAKQLLLPHIDPPIVVAQLSIVGVGGGFGKASGGAGCANSVTFLARVAGAGGSPNGTETTMIQNFICNLTTDGVIDGNLGTTGCGTTLDDLYLFNVDSTVTANLNICGTTHTLSATAMIFTADQGYKSNTNGFLDTGHNMHTETASCGNGAATCNYLASGATGSFGFYILTSDTTNAYINMGATDAITTSQLLPYFNLAGQAINQTGTFLMTQTNANGMSIIDRPNGSVGSGNIFQYNATATPTTSNDAVGAANLPPNVTMYISGRNNSGAVDSSNTFDITLGAFIAKGGGVTQAGKIAHRFNCAAKDNGGLNVYTDTCP